MLKENYKELLVDLYSAYNPDFIKYIPSLVDKYSGGLEFDSIQHILIKYNHESYSHYDEAKSTDEYIHSLIKDYNNGNRSLKDFTIEMHIKRKEEQESNKSKEQKKIEEAAKEKAKKELSGVKDKLTETEKKIDEAQKKLEEKLDKINKQLGEVGEKTTKSSIYDEVEISIKSNYTDSELVLPNKEILAGLGKGTRLIVSDKEGRMIGLVIEEILYDCISHPEGKSIVEIIISKG